MQINNIKSNETHDSKFQKPEQAHDDALPTWGAITASFELLARFAKSVGEGRGCDFTGEVGEAKKMLAAIEVARVGLDYLVEEFNDEIERSLNWHREVIEGLTPLKITSESDA